MTRGFETRRPLGPLAVQALLVLLASGTWSAAAFGLAPPPSPPSQAGDTDPLAGTAAGTPPLPPAAVRPPRDLRNEQIQELYRQALRSWASAQEERACEQLMAVETAVVDDREATSRKRLLRAEEAVIHAVAAADLEVLIPIARLHFEVSKRYLAQSRGFALVLTHSRGMVRDLAILYREQTGTPSAAQVSSAMLTSLGELMRSAAQHASAAELFEQAIVLDPKNAVASLGLAMVYEKHEQYRAAVDTLRRLLQASPDHVEGRLRLAINLRRVDRRDEARKLLEALVALPPGTRARAGRLLPSPAAAGGAAGGSPSATSAASLPDVAAAPAATPPSEAAPDAAQQAAATKAAVDALFAMTATGDPSAAGGLPHGPAPGSALTAPGTGVAGDLAPAASAPMGAAAAGLPAGPAPTSPAAPGSASPAGPAAQPAAPASALAPAAPVFAAAEDIGWVQRIAAQELAQIYDEAGHHAAAVKVLRAALERYPASATLRIELAEVLDHSGDIRGSHAVLERLLELPAGHDDNCRFLYNSPSAETFAEPRAVFAEGARSRLPALAAALGLPRSGAPSGGAGGGL